MRYTIIDKKNNFTTFFDTDTGFYIRSDVLFGAEAGNDPFMASYPHLIDVGVMGHCTHGQTGICSKSGVECYQSGLLRSEPNMPIEHFRRIAQESAGRCCQFALGGRGDPDQHEHFSELLSISRAHGIVPNFTTSGYGMTEELANLCRKFCGAVAVSWYGGNYTRNAIRMLLNAGVTTNIHYVLGKHSIDDAVRRLRAQDFPEGTHAVIFLLHKPVGQGSQENVLDLKDPRLETFFSEADKPHPFRIGLDSCSVPAAIRFMKNTMPESLDTCEGGRFSCYISPNLRMLPCSFDQDSKYEVDLSDGTSIEAGWNSAAFHAFRSKLQNSCPSCMLRGQCMGGCPLQPEIVLCDRTERGIS